MVFVQVSYKNFANKHKQNVPNYAVNNEIWFDIRNMQTKRSSKKISDIFDGPFLITKIINPHVYKFELPRDWTIHPIFYTNLFRPGSTNFLPGQLTPPPIPIIDEKNQNTWEMTRNLNFKMFKNRFQFFVNWVENVFIGNFFFLRTSPEPPMF